MTYYQIQLREIRLATDGTDDVALFDVKREEDGETWIVPALLSPLFRLVNMQATASEDSRREMVAGLGARAIVERLNQGAEPPLDDPPLLSLSYPGAPDDPEPFPSYDHLTIEVGEYSSSQMASTSTE
ncbi:MAG: hypothetical protein PVJ55_04510 [Anaerolineae bacterium]|jgi:hypothetical protein